MFTISSLQITLDYFVIWFTGFFDALDQINLIDLGSLGYYTLFNFFQSMIILEVISILWWIFRGRIDT
ncbi:hypothetical protein [Methanorbis rubei]|uniref:Uncharacterized protein n=1 Tax=Methanorbis rubei TaxID=3028300 RepID=A0AAE4SBT0_9EURY|nr:hypothetical protein [Methanocorpusculaceae archaeon Cs1]